jgi:hypothetical protein
MAAQLTEEERKSAVQEFTRAEFERFVKACQNPLVLIQRLHELLRTTPQAVVQPQTEDPVHRGKTMDERAMIEAHLQQLCDARDRTAPGFPEEEQACLAILRRDAERRKARLALVLPDLIRQLSQETERRYQAPGPSP